MATASIRRPGFWARKPSPRRPIPRNFPNNCATFSRGRRGGGRSTFTVTGGPAATKDLFEGIDTTWNRLPGGAAIGAILDEAIRGFEPAHPDKIIAQLVKARPLIAAAAISDPLANVKLAE